MHSRAIRFRGAFLRRPIRVQNHRLICRVRQPIAVVHSFVMEMKLPGQLLAESALRSSRRRPSRVSRSCAVFVSPSPAAGPETKRAQNNSRERASGIESESSMTAHKSTDCHFEANFSAPPPIAGSTGSGAGVPNSGVGQPLAAASHQRTEVAPQRRGFHDDCRSELFDLSTE